MPYEGISVSIDEMLQALVLARKSESIAAVELERAIEDGRISLFLPDGTDEDGQLLYCKLSPLGRSHVIAIVRDFPNRMKIPLIRYANTPIEMIKAVRAIRLEFEVVCQLREPPADAAGSSQPSDGSREARQVAVRSCIEGGLIPAKTSTWDAFCNRVRDIAGGWADKKNGEIVRGFDEKTIKRDVAALMN